MNKSKFKMEDKVRVGYIGLGLRGASMLKNVSPK